MHRKNQMMESMKKKLFDGFICCKLFVSSEKFKGCFTHMLHVTLFSAQLFSTAHWKTEFFCCFFVCQQDYLKITELKIL